VSGSAAEMYGYLEMSIIGIPRSPGGDRSTGGPPEISYSGVKNGTPAIFQTPHRRNPSQKRSLITKKLCVITFRLGLVLDPPENPPKSSEDPPGGTPTP
jgi:hypothetical protein